VQAYLKMIIST